MAKQITTSITINASRATVWKILTDFEKYPDWNPFIKSVSGAVKVGNQIKIKLQGMTFKPVVLTLTENAELKWLGHFWFKGLFDGEHRFHITENADGTTQFEQTEKFSGIFVKLLSRTIEKDTTQGFEDMNRALKLRAENEASRT